MELDIGIADHEGEGFAERLNVPAHGRVRVAHQDAE